LKAQSSHKYYRGLELSSSVVILDNLWASSYSMLFPSCNSFEFSILPCSSMCEAAGHYKVQCCCNRSNKGYLHQRKLKLMKVKHLKQRAMLVFSW